MPDNGNTVIEDPIQLKDLGNTAFKECEYNDALNYYTRAADIPEIKDVDLAIVLKNRAMVHLKMEDWQEAVDDCTKSLELVSLLTLLPFTKRVPAS